MIEEPYRWLEAISNRREYVREQLKTGTPVFGVGLTEGVLLLGVGTGDSKVFELFDRQALTGLGHPADLEKLRRSIIDAAHTEAFTRAPDDVSLRRLIGFGLSPELKSGFEQVFSAPFLAELLLAEVGPEPGKDSLVRLHFDGAYQLATSGAMVAGPDPDREAAAQEWLNESLSPERELKEAVDTLLQAWWCLQENHPFGGDIPKAADRREGWQNALDGRTVEIGWLARSSERRARYTSLTLEAIGL